MRFETFSRGGYTGLAIDIFPKIDDDFTIIRKVAVSFYGFP
jgi:hypothetical protein